MVNTRRARIPTKSLLHLWRSRRTHQNQTGANQMQNRTDVTDVHSTLENSAPLVNPDVIAWIDIPGLSISYPVVQGTDNAYYLHHLFTGEYNSSGSIFADWHNQPDFADPNTIVYGHNMKNGSMFGTLSHYQDQALWEENPYFYLYVPGKVMEYQIFSCYAGYVGSEAYTYAFPEADDFQNFLGKIRSYAGYDTGVEVGETDRVVTLSTCVSSRRDYRYIVHGKLVEEIAN